MIKAIVHSSAFKSAVIAAIVLSCIFIGVETNRSLVDAYPDLFRTGNLLFATVFLVEILLRIAARAPKPWTFFQDAWNVFDFTIVALTVAPVGAEYVVVLRLFRVLRVLRLLTAFPKLQLLVGALLKSLPSMGYVIFLLSIHFYIFAVLGTFLFGTNDPLHFGSLGNTFVTLFQVVTLEGWVEVMNVQRFGCTNCALPQPFPFIAPLYFITFILFGTMIILNLLIGVVVNSMTEMHRELIEGRK